MLDLLKRRISAAVGAYEWNGETVHFRKLSAGKWLAIQSLASTEADNDPAKAVAFYVELLAATLCSSQGTTECESESGREALQQLSMGELQSLGSLSLAHNGLGGEAKN